MKKLFIISLITLISYANLYSQDILTTKSGEDISVKVTEIGISEVKYKKFSNIEGPTYTMLKSEILIIRYQNGSKDIFNDTITKPTPQVVEKFNIIGTWKSSSGMAFIVSALSGGNYIYFNNQQKETIIEINPKKDKNGNPILNVYTTTSGYEFTVKNNELIILQSISNSEDVKTWTKIPPQQDNIISNNSNSTSSVSTGNDDKEISYFKKNGASGWFFNYSDPAFSMYTMREKSIFKSDFGFGYVMGATFIDDISVYNLGSRLSYHYPNSTLLDPYGGISSGWAWFNDEDNSVSDSYWDWHLGLIWHINETFGLTTEYSGRGEAIYFGFTWNIVN